MHVNCKHHNMSLAGKVTLELRDDHGHLKHQEVCNTIVTVGKNFLADWLAQTSQATPFMNFVALGTGTNAPTVSDTALQTPLGTRKAGAITDNLNVWQNQVTFNPGEPAAGTNSITEAALFSAVTGGTMFARVTFTAVGKEAGDSLTVTWQVTFS